jgi:uncharacterized membrane protein YjjB (DUF3815 family)
MTNWRTRLGAALTTLGLAVAAINPPKYLTVGLFIAAGGKFFTVLWPETEGGAKALKNILPIGKP